MSIPVAQLLVSAAGVALTLAAAVWLIRKVVTFILMDELRRQTRPADEGEILKGHQGPITPRCNGRWGNLPDKSLSALWRVVARGRTGRVKEKDRA